jgi:DNA-directed RNA polymerase subunit beta
MNIGQLFETHLGMAARALGMKVASPSFNGVPMMKIKSLLKEAGFPETASSSYTTAAPVALTKSAPQSVVMYMIKLQPHGGRQDPRPFNWSIHYGHPAATWW